MRSARDIPFKLFGVEVITLSLDSLESVCVPTRLLAVHAVLSIILDTFSGDAATDFFGLGIGDSCCLDRDIWWHVSASRNRARAWNALTASFADVIFCSKSDGLIGNGDETIHATADSKGNFGCQRRRDESSGSSDGSIPSSEVKNTWKYQTIRNSV